MGTSSAYFQPLLASGFSNFFSLNFPNPEEASNFSVYMKRALDDVTGRMPYQFTPAPPKPAPPVQVEENNNDVGLFDNNQPMRKPPPQTRDKNYDRIQIGDRNYR